MTKRKFLEIASKMGISQDLLKLNISVLHGKRITSQFNPSARKNTAPFLVLDDEKLNKEFRAFLTELADKITTSIR